MKNTRLLHHPIAFGDVKRILVKRFGSEYNAICDHDPVDFAVGCELRYLLEQLYPLLPARLLLDLYEHKGKSPNALHKVLLQAVRRVRYYGDLLFLLNILGVTFGPAYLPHVKRQYVEQALAQIREEIDLLLIEQRILEICLQQFRQSNGPGASHELPAPLWPKVSEHLQRSRSKAALYYLLDLIINQSLG